MGKMREIGWYVSSRTDSGACVEVRDHDGTVQVRDSKDRTGPVLSFGYEQWQAFVAAVKSDSLDPMDG